MRRIIAALLALFFIAPGASAEVCAFRLSGGAAAVDAGGNLLIPPGMYDSIYTLYEEDGAFAGYAAGIGVGSALRYAIISPAGERLTEFLYQSVEPAGGAFICGDGRGYRIVSSKGVEGPESYAAAAYAGEGAFLTLSGNIYDEIADPLTLLAENGLRWQPGIYTLYGLGRFSQDLMPICDGGRVLFGYIGRDGAWKIPAQYEYAGDFAGGYAAVSTRAGYGLIDLSGAAAIEPAYDYLAREGNLVLTMKGEALALYEIRPEGLSLLFEREISGASPRLSGTSVVLYADDGVQVLNSRGEPLFSAFPSASVSATGDLFVVRDGSWAEASAFLADAHGVPLSTKFNSVRHLEGTGDSALFAYGVMAGDSYDMAFGLMRGSGEIISEAVYDELARVGPGLFCAANAEGAKLIDQNGDLITKLY